jgi:hypothetical protein
MDRADHRIVASIGEPVVKPYQDLRAGSFEFRSLAPHARRKSEEIDIALTVSSRR